MSKIVYLLLAFCMVGAPASAQITPIIKNQLQSPDWEDREKAYKTLAEQKSPSPEAKKALIDLLQLEDAPESYPPIPPELIGNKEYEGPLGWMDYVSRLMETVMQIVEREPRRQDALKALCDNHDYGVPSDISDWFAKHGDQTANYFLAAATGKITGLSAPHQAHAIEVLAQIIKWERTPGTAHRLNPSDVQLLDQAIRTEMDDSRHEVRQSAIWALGTTGTSDDLALLDRIVTTGGQGGEDKDLAKSAAIVIRRRIATDKK